VKNVSLASAALLLAAGCAPDAPIVVVDVTPAPAVTAAAPPPEHDAAPARKVAVAAPAGAGAAELEALRDPRPRAELLPTGQIFAEIQQNEALFAATQPGAPDRQRIAHWLTREYARFVDATRRDAEGADATARIRIDRVTAGARASEIKYLTLLAHEYPTGCTAPPPQDETAMCPDGATYLAAYESERADRLGDARRLYLELLQGFPASRFVPHAYLAFGEMFLREGKQEAAKLPLAEQSYLEVRKYPPPTNDVYGYALLRLGEVYALKGDPPRARATWARLRLYAEQNPRLPGATVPARMAPE
jgi:TolA-binding protein